MDGMLTYITYFRPRPCSVQFSLPSMIKEEEYNNINIDNNNLETQMPTSVASDFKDKIKIIPFSIIQCLSCRHIIGDTATLQPSNFDSSFTLITLNYKSDHVIVDGELETSKGENELDYGSTYNKLQCKSCSQLIGKMYRTTTSELDNLRGKFSFNMNQIILYEIGRGQAEQKEQEDPVLPNNKPEYSTSASVSASEDSIEIIKLQKFVLALYDRIEQLEIENDGIKQDLTVLSRQRSGESSLSNTTGNSKNQNNNNTVSSSVPKTSKNSNSNNSNIPQVQSAVTQSVPVTTTQNQKQNPSSSSTSTSHTTPVTTSSINFKSMVAKIADRDFDFKASEEQEYLINSFDEETAMEMMSWSILNSGRISQFQSEFAQ